jgi:hypothetical protein
MAANKLYEFGGKVHAKPEREDYKTEAEYRRSLQEFNDKLRAAGSKAFDDQFRKSVKGKAADDDFKREKPAPGSAADEERKRKVAEMMQKWAKG